MSVCMCVFIQFWKAVKRLNMKQTYGDHKRNSYFNWSL